MCGLFIYPLSFSVMHDRKERRKRRAESKFSCLFFLTMRRIKGTLGVYFTLKQLRVFTCKSFVSLCCGYLGADLVPYVQDAIFNLPNPYLRSITILLDRATCNYMLS